MSDTAQPNPKHIIAIYGPKPNCVFTGHWQNVDMAHILGRGYEFGIRPGTKERKIFSSILAVVPLFRDIHNGPLRDSVEIRHLFLRVARDRVNNAVALGDYKLNNNDTAFISFSDKWRADNPIL